MNLKKQFVTENNKQEEKFLTWDNEMGLGIKEIDEQHKALVDIMNRLYNVSSNFPELMY